MIRATHGVEGRREQLRPGLVRRGQTVVQVEDDRLDHGSHERRAPHIPRHRSLIPVFCICTHLRLGIVAFTMYALAEARHFDVIAAH
jgi:hypothetical protein